MKSLAEQLREFMDQVLEAPIKSASSYDLTVTIPNWVEPMNDQEAEDWEEEVEVGVNYQISGRHYAATLEQPAEEPEMELQVYCLDTGEDVTNKISERTYDSISEQAWDDAKSRKNDYDGDYGRDDESVVANGQPVISEEEWDDDANYISPDEEFSSEFFVKNLTDDQTAPEVEIIVYYTIRWNAENDAIDTPLIAVYRLDDEHEDENGDPYDLKDSMSSALHDEILTHLQDCAWEKHNQRMNKRP